MKKYQEKNSWVKHICNENDGNEGDSDDDNVSQAKAN